MELLAPIDLSYHIRLGQNSLLGGLDPTQNYLPYWNCGLKRGDVTGFWHSGAWDRCHDVARAMHGLVVSEEVLGERVEEGIIRGLTEHLFSLFDEDDGLPGTSDGNTGKRVVNLHNVREAIHALTALIKRGNCKADRLARRLVRTVLDALDEKGRIHLDRLPRYVEDYSHQPGQEGRAVDALIRYYRISEDDKAVELAGSISTFALEHCFTPFGTLTQEAGTHGHSINAMVAGMLDLALLTNDAALLQRVKKVYDVGLPRFNSSFGWSMESLKEFVPRGESNNTGDLLRASLLLGHAGFHEYFERAERILRGHLLPSQVIDVEAFSDEPNAEDHLRNLASRIRGGFSFPTPNDFLYKPDAPIVTYDITSGAVDGMCEAWRSIITENDAGIWVNLLLSCERKGVKLRSYVSGEGKIDIQNETARNIFIRIPRWVSPKKIRLKLDGLRHALSFVGSYLLVHGKGGFQKIDVRFPVYEVRTMETIAFQRYTIDWRGDQIVAMSPPAENLPMFPPCGEDRKSAAQPCV